MTEILKLLPQAAKVTDFTNEIYTPTIAAKLLLLVYLMYLFFPLYQSTLFIIDDHNQFHTHIAHVLP